jgi:hypothetical protein
MSGNTIKTSGGDGIVIKGTASIEASLTANRITTRGAGYGVDIRTAGTSAAFTFATNDVDSRGGGGAISVLGSARANTLTFTSNYLIAGDGANALVVALSTSSKTDVHLTGNNFITGHMGTGLVLQGGPAFEAVVQGNNFNVNRVGVAVFGNGTTDGVVDLGGGPLHSTGGNFFTSFRSATPTAYAIGLFNVITGQGIYAFRNKFSVSPELVIADGSHDPGAGGSGAILVGVQAAERGQGQVHQRGRSESPQNGLTHNDAYLEGRDGKKRLRPSGQSIDRLTDSQALIDYYFSDNKEGNVPCGKPEDWKLALRIPARLLEVEVPFSYKDVPLP